VPRMRLGGHPRLAALVMKKLENSLAYRCGWIDGFYEELGCFTENRRLAEWETASARLDYYRGHRDGRETRLNGGLLARATHNWAPQMREERA
jgi:hypothetical protein